MRTVIGIAMGMGLVIYLTSRYGQYGFELLHRAPAITAAASGPIAESRLQPLATVADEPAARSAAIDKKLASAAVIAAGGTEAADADSDGARQWLEYSAQGRHLPVSGEFPWRQCFRRAAAAYQVPESLLLAVARGESSFDASARSQRDAVGVMQIRWPLTAKHLGIDREQMLYDPCTNIDAGARYLRELLDSYDDDYRLAVAAYNYGPARVQAGSVPPAARAYSAYIMRHLQAILGGAAMTADTPVAAPPGPAGRTLLLRFGRAWHARAYSDFLRETAPELALSTESLARGQYAVYLSWSSAADYRRAMDLLDSRGLPALAGRAGGPGNLQEQSHDF